MNDGSDAAGAAVPLIDARPALHVDASGAGRPLVLLHGFAMHGGLFAPIVPALAATRRVLVPDLPGHGRSPPMTPLELDAIVAAVDAALAGAGVPQDTPLDVVGWSLGGAVALRLAASRPARVRRLALVATTPSFVSRDDWPHAMADATLRRFGDELRAAYRLTLMRFLTLQTQGSDGGRATLAALRRALFERGEPSRDALDATLALLRSLDLRADATAVRAPTLVVTGDRDTIAPQEAGAWLAAAIPGAELARMPGAAHAPFLSHAPEFAAALAAFLDAR